MNEWLSFSEGFAFLFRYPSSAIQRLWVSIKVLACMNVRPGLSSGMRFSLFCNTARAVLFTALAYAVIVVDDVTVRRVIVFSVHN